MVSKKTTTLIHKTYLNIFVCFAFLSTATTAYAGFQWVPASESIKATPAAPAPVDVPEPLSAQNPEQNSLPLEPLPILQSQDMDMPEDQSVKNEQPDIMTPIAKEEASAPEGPTEQTKVIMPEDAPDSALQNTLGGNRLLIKAFPSEAEIATTASTIPSAAPSPSAPSVAAADVVGFGTDMPLALALRQIVPADYAFSFGENVNPGYRVSWSGGKAWDFSGC